MMRYVSFAFVLLAAAPAVAQDAAPAVARDAAPPVAPVTLDVQAQDVVDAEALRDALEADLGVTVRLVHDGAAQVIVSNDPDGRLTLRVRRADGDVLERETDPDEGRERTVTSVSLIVANLVRDESSEILALLRIERHPEGEPELEAEPAPEPEAEPAPEPEAEPAPELEPAPEPEPELEHVPAAIDFVPWVGFSTAGQGRDRRNLAFGAIGALAGRIEGASVSSVLDLTLGEVRGLQLAGVAGLAFGDVRGVQATGVLSLSTGAVHGVQLSAIASIAPDGVEGIQSSGVASIAPGGVDGLQLGLVSAAGRVRGGQLGLVNVAAHEEGQAVAGLQLGLANVAVGEVAGAQLGLANVSSGDVAGAQLGLLNIATGRVRGLQLGLVNVAETADASIGLVNVQTAGRTQLRAHVDTNGYIGATLVHGSGVTRWLLTAAGNPFLAERPGGLAGVGMGFRIDPVDILHLDLELVHQVVLDSTISQRAPDMIEDVRVVVGVQVFEGFGIFGALGYRIHYTPDRGDTVELGAPFGVSTIAEDRTNLFRGWPTIQAGVELF